MKFLKLWLWCWVAIAGVGTIYAQTESQLSADQEAAAREALRKSLEQPVADPSARKLERDRTLAEAESQARAKREADRIMAERARRSAITPAASDGDDAAVREALRRALEDAEKTPPSPKPAPQPLPAETSKPAPVEATTVIVPPASSEPASQVQPRTVRSAPVETPAAAVPPAPAETFSNAEETALREALRRAMEEREATAAIPQPRKAPIERRVKPETKESPVADSNQPPMTTVVSPPVPKSKAKRLMDLTEAYRRDEVTPAQYHQERAKILAEPK